MPELADVLDEAYEALYDNKIEAARAALDRARRIDPKSAEVRLFEVELLDAEGSSEEAVSAAEEALEQLPKSMLIKVKLATLLLDVYDDVAGARPLLEDVLGRIDKGEKPDVQDTDEARADFLAEILLTLSDARAADHDPRGALELAERAAKAAPDDALSRVALGAAQLDMCLLDDAEKSCAQAIDRDPRCADAYWLRGRVLTSRADHAGADKAFTRAIELDGERFQKPFRVSEDQFAKLVEEALEELPQEIREYMQNVAIVVEDVPDAAEFAKNDPPLSPGSLGLHEGTPRPRQGTGQTLSLPTRIVLFRKNHEIAVSNEDQMRDEVSTTLLHEIGHYLDLDEDEVDERGLS
jgi:predicted Zn-dependent protease with MMP-like domain